MVKVQAPALSLEASGQLGGALVFSKWKGRPYVRSLVKPANPKSGGQVGMREMFKFLAQKWDGLSGADQATWEDRADQLIVSTFNAYMSYNQFRWRDFLAPSTADPAATADTPPTDGAGSAVAGVRSITVTQAITAAADGWGVAFFRALTTGFATAFDNLIGVGLIVGTADVILVDSPLDPDTYYYNMRSFTLDGQLGSEIGEVNATVT
jgi:hypothetical protein